MPAQVTAFVLLCAWGLVAFGLATWSEARHAGAPPPLSLPAIALSLAVAALAGVLRPLDEALPAGAACIALLAAAPADRRTGYLFDALTLPAGIVSLALVVAFGLEQRAAGGVTLLVGSFGALVWLSRGRLMGLGDVKAMYALGAAFGPLESTVAIGVACLSAIITLALDGSLRRGRALPFGPHLAAGSVVALAVGDPIVHSLVRL